MTQTVKARFQITVNQMKTFRFTNGRLKEFRHVYTLGSSHCKLLYHFFSLDFFCHFLIPHLRFMLKASKNDKLNGNKCGIEQIYNKIYGQKKTLAYNT